MKSTRSKNNKEPSPKVTKCKPIRKARNISRKKPESNPVSFDILQDIINNMDMNEFMDRMFNSYFVGEEQKKNVIKIDDKENELDSLVEEFAAVDTDSEDEFASLFEEFATDDSDSEDKKKESTAKVIFSPSDNEIDDLLDDFEYEDIK